MHEYLLRALGLGPRARAWSGGLLAGAQSLGHRAQGAEAVQILLHSLCTDILPLLRMHARTCILVKMKVFASAEQGLMALIFGNEKS